MASKTMINGRAPIDILEENIDIAWKEYLKFLIDRNLPLPDDLDAAKQYFRGGFVYCMAEYYSDHLS